MDLLENTGVLCTPGSAFGSEGEGHVRFALVLPPEEIKKAVEALREIDPNLSVEGFEQIKTN